MKDIYRERAALVAVLVRVAVAKGWSVGWYLDPDLETPADWPVVRIVLPTGQVSWHIAREDFDCTMPINLPRVPRDWDGHTKPEALRRLLHCEWEKT